MWKSSHSAQLNVPAPVIWKYWTEVEKWPEYDTSIKSATINGAFELGTTITVSLRSGPKIKFSLSIVTSNIGFVLVGKLPLAAIRLNHHIDELKSGASFTQSISISGPLWWLYAPLIGGKLERDTKARVNKMAILIEHEYDPNTDPAT